MANYPKMGENADMAIRATITILAVLTSGIVCAQAPPPEVIPGSCTEPLATLAGPSNRAAIQRIVDDVLKGRWPSGTPLGASPDDVTIARFLSAMTAHVPVLPNPSFHSALERLVAEFSTKPERKTEIRDQVLACFPAVAEALQKEAAARAERAEAERARERRYALQRQQQEEVIRREQEQREAEAKKPINLLRTSYANYIFIKRCYDDRQGYLMVYISDPELARARHAVSRIEEKLKPDLPPSVTTDSLWSEANALIDKQRMPLVQPFCQTKLRSLEQTHRSLIPEDDRTPKDFPSRF